MSGATLDRQALETASAPGRSCPLDYRYTPRSLRTVPTLEAAVLWGVDGLYGNTEALATLQGLIAHDTLLAHGRGERVEVVANGDLHWSDIDEAAFAAVQSGVGAWHAMRGNVEAELGRDAVGADDAGCGCGCPESVRQADVDNGAAGMASFAGTTHAASGSAAARHTPSRQPAAAGSGRPADMLPLLHDRPGRAAR